MPHDTPRPKPSNPGETLWRRLREQLEEALRRFSPPPEAELIPIPVRRR